MLEIDFSGVTDKVYCLFETMNHSESNSGVYQPRYHKRATGQLREDFLKCLADSQPEISVKYDGTNSFIDPKVGTVFKRIDPNNPHPRNTSTLPKEEWTSSYSDEFHTLFWVDVLKAKDPVDSAYYSAMKWVDSVLHLRVLVYPEDKNAPLALAWKPISEFNRTTYELMGPNTGTIVNAYDFPAHPCISRTDTWEVETNEHFFVEHGAFTVDIPNDVFTDHAKLREAVINLKVEGVVFAFYKNTADRKYFKVNRNHVDAREVGFPLHIVPGVPMSDVLTP